MKVALVHDFLMQLGGAERVLGALHSMFPSAPVFTLLADQRLRNTEFADWNIHPVSRFQSSAIAKSKYKALFPFYPADVDRLDLSEFDLVISSSYAYAHGVRTRPRTPHICYCHTPMRFVWFQEKEYRTAIPAPLRGGYDFAIRRLRKWDLEASHRPSVYLANCERMADRIEQAYGKKARVLYPPVQPPAQPTKTEYPEAYFLIVARLVYPYKRIDLAIEAARRTGIPLRIVGEGDDRPRFEAMAKGAPVKFLGRVSEEELANQYTGAYALVMPWDEDFGIAPVEANLYGKPVVGYRNSGLMESQVEDVTAILFDRLTADDLASAMESCVSKQWSQQAIRDSAARFSTRRFRDGIRQVIDDLFSAEAPPHAPEPSHNSYGVNDATFQA